MKGQKLDTNTQTQLLNHRAQDHLIQIHGVPVDGLLIGIQLYLVLDQRIIPQIIIKCILCPTKNQFHISSQMITRVWLG